MWTVLSLDSCQIGLASGSTELRTSIQSSISRGAHHRPSWTNRLDFKISSPSRAITRLPNHESFVHLCCSQFSGIGEPSARVSPASLQQCCCFLSYHPPSASLQRTVSTLVDCRCLVPLVLPLSLWNVSTLVDCHFRFGWFASSCLLSLSLRTVFTLVDCPMLFCISSPVSRHTSFCN